MRQLAPVLRTRRMTIADLPGVMEIEKEAFTNPWSVEMVKKELTQDWSVVLLLEESTPWGWELRGFGIFWLVAGEVHVLNVATHVASRRKGYGRRLMDEVLAMGRARSCTLATLEVRRSNAAAIALYTQLGFRTVGMRPRYYADNQEDAAVMIMDL
ncbi:MAG: ribosomal protein S18-alanine N-acetyltransferase [Myxococcaceae bacterium]|nr:ribosomal protein S18-alanine N-acetyltransferase [Myxococcaceae bacterium]